jgi:hypothetical protein
MLFCVAEPCATDHKASKGIACFPPPFRAESRFFFSISYFEIGGEDAGTYWW